MIGRFVNDHPKLTLLLAWLTIGGWIPYIGGTIYYRIGVVLALGVLAVSILVLLRLRLLIRDGVKVTGGEFIRMLWRELWNRVNYRRQWRRACQAYKLTVKVNGQTITPPLRQLTWNTSEDFTAVIYPDRLGVKGGIPEFQKRASGIARALGVKDVTIREQPHNPGVADVAISRSDVLDRTFKLEDMPWGPKGTIEYGIRRDGSPATLSPHMSVMISGMTRRGKSVVVRVMLASLMRHGIPTRLYIADPKGGVQMAEWEDRMGKLTGGCIEVAAYETEPAKIKAMVDAVGDQMHKRYASMKRRGITQHVPTPEEPLLLVIFDESIPLHSILAEGHKGAAGQIGYQGAGACVSMWLLTQLTEKVVMGQIRDLVPQRLCFATKTWQQTDMALGDGASQCGAESHRLGDKRGIGYSGAEHDATFSAFRVPEVTDAQAKRHARGHLPAAYLAAPDPVEPWTVYLADGVRQFEDGTTGPIVLYVGKTKAARLNDRLKEHRQEPDPAGREWREYVWRFKAIAEVPTETDALEREEAEIKARGPYWNIIHNGGNELYPEDESVVLVPKRQKRSERRAARRSRPAQPQPDLEAVPAADEAVEADTDWWDPFPVEGAAE